MPEPLSIDQLKVGRLKALQNADELLNEAFILFDNRCWARVVFLSQIVAEEIGKYIMVTSALADTIVNSESFSWRKFWHRYLSHTAKSQNTQVFEDFVLTDIDSYPAYFKKIRGIVSGLEKGRQISLYSDYIENNFYSPSELFTEKMATDALARARGRMRLISEFESNSLFKLDGMTAESIRERISAFRDKFRDIWAK
jgi:AbiV family abortive infection protein